MQLELLIPTHAVRRLEPGAGVPGAAIRALRVAGHEIDHPEGA